MPKSKQKSEWTNLLTNKTISFLEFYGCNVWRQNNIATPGRAFIGRAGIGDIGGMTPNGIHLEVEIKTTGDKLSSDQIKHGKSVLKHSGIYLVVRTYSDWENLKRIFEKTNEQKRTPKTDRTEEEIRSYVQRECEAILRKEKEWNDWTEAKHEERKEKERFKRALKKAANQAKRQTPPRS